MYYLYLIDIKVIKRLHKANNNFDEPNADAVCNLCNCILCSDVIYISISATEIL
jgi:hypothetical protein